MVTNFKIHIICDVYNHLFFNLPVCATIVFHCIITFHYYNSLSAVFLFYPLSTQKLKQSLYSEAKFMAIL